MKPALHLVLHVVSIRRALVRWYEKSKRDLPWRRTRDPYAIWVSEIMLQQTRVAAVIPYYERFLARFPDIPTLADASEPQLLAMWSGLGYYSRARNLQTASKQIANGFPSDYNSIREMPGVGDYTAAAVASIAFGLPRAAVDGNVRRVIVRLSNHNGVDANAAADRLLDRSDPGRWNQAMMELGATVCLPRDPHCGECPLSRACLAHQAGTQNELPYKREKPTPERLDRTLLIIRAGSRRGNRVLLVPSPRVEGFWDLPEPFVGARVGDKLGEFRHTITHRHYRFAVFEAVADSVPKGGRWWSTEQIPLSTTAKKALRLASGFLTRANLKPT